MVLELIEQGLFFQSIQQDYYPQLFDQQLREGIQYAIAIVKEADSYVVEELARE